MLTSFQFEMHILEGQIAVFIAVFGTAPFLQKCLMVNIALERGLMRLLTWHQKYNFQKAPVKFNKITAEIDR